MIDRFGPVPPPTKTLFAIVYLKLLAATLGIVRLRAGRDGGWVEFGHSGAKVDAEAIVSLIQSEPATYRLDGPFKLRFAWEAGAEDRRVPAVETILRRLGAHEPLIAAA
jgi:transcription-repair coupling factor (superfamily II helicase)